MTSTSSDPASLGRYTLLAKLAAGGMGEIFLGRLEGEGGFAKLVVIKRLLPELVASEEFVTLFLNEARIAAQLSHHNICDVYELGSADGQYYIAMQYLHGVAVSRIAAQTVDGPEQHVRVAASLIAQACDGLHHAHELLDAAGTPLGLVHRDVSPSNLLVTVDGVLKVLDFGIAKAHGVPSLTSKGAVRGKFTYMSPEQLRGEALDRRSDLFSLGIVMHEAMTRQRLFHRASEFLVARAILEEPYPAAHDVAPEVPRALSAVVSRALERHPSRRFQTARAMGAAIRDGLGALGGPMSAAEIGERIERAFHGELQQQRAVYEQAARAASSPAAVSPAPGNLMAREGRMDPTPGDRRTVSMKRPPAPPASEVLETQPPAHRARWPWLVVVAVLIASGVALLASGPRSGGVVGAAPDGGPAPEALVVLTPPDARRAARDAAAPDAAQGADASAAEARPARRAPPPVPAPGRPGTFSIESDPWARIYVDGQLVGDTPIIDHALPAGLHRVRAVLADGRSQTFRIRVRPGKRVPPRRLYW